MENKFVSQKVAKRQKATFLFLTNMIISELTQKIKRKNERCYIKSITK